MQRKVNCVVSLVFRTAFRIVQHTGHRRMRSTPAHRLQLARTTACMGMWLCVAITHCLSQHQQQQLLVKVRVCMLLLTWIDGEVGMGAAGFCCCYTWQAVLSHACSDKAPCITFKCFCVSLRGRLLHQTLGCLVLIVPAG